MEINNFSRKMKVLPKNVSTEAPPLILSKEQHQFYQDNGFLVIKNLIAFTDLYNCKRHFINICNGRASAGQATVVKETSLVGKRQKKEDYINKIQDIHYDEVFMGYTEHPRLVDVVAQFVGGDVAVINSMFINKPPGTGEHPPHQDLHYFPFRPAHKIVAAWTAVDHVTTDNGCLWVVPRSHAPATLHAHGNMPGAMKMYHGILDQSVGEPQHRVQLEMSPGDTVFFHPLIIHGSGANTSKNYRKCLTAHYANSHCENVNVEGTVQEGIAREIEGEARRRGFDVSFAEVWRYKSKHIRGSSKL